MAHSGLTPADPVPAVPAAGISGSRGVRGPGGVATPRPEVLAFHFDEHNHTHRVALANPRPGRGSLTEVHGRNVRAIGSVAGDVQCIAGRVGHDAARLSGRPQ